MRPSRTSLGRTAIVSGRRGDWQEAACLTRRGRQADCCGDRMAVKAILLMASPLVMPGSSQACADCVNLSALPGIHVFRAARRGWHRNSGLPELLRYDVPEVGHTRLPGTSPAMTWLESAQLETAVGYAVPSLAFRSDPNATAAHISRATVSDQRRPAGRS